MEVFLCKCMSFSHIVFSETCVTVILILAINKITIMLPIIVEINFNLLGKPRFGSGNQK